jgi:hypothetical protein
LKTGGLLGKFGPTLDGGGASITEGVVLGTFVVERASECLDETIGFQSIAELGGEGFKVRVGQRDRPISGVVGESR